jgi:hypothetical protein
MRSPVQGLPLRSCKSVDSGTWWFLRALLAPTCKTGECSGSPKNITSRSAQLVTGTVVGVHMSWQLGRWDPRRVIRQQNWSLASRRSSMVSVGVGG